MSANFTGKITEHLEVTGARSIQGALENGATVHPGGDLYVQGAVAGRLIIEAGGTVVIQGACTSDVTLRGKLIVSGVFMGALGDYTGILALYVGTVLDDGILQADGTLAPFQENNKIDVNMTVENLRCLTPEGQFVTTAEMRALRGVEDDD
jgi:hypothetical protein